MGFLLRFLMYMSLPALYFAEREYPRKIVDVNDKFSSGKLSKNEIEYYENYFSINEKKLAISEKYWNIEKAKVSIDENQWGIVLHKIRMLFFSLASAGAIARAWQEIKSYFDRYRSDLRHKYKLRKRIKFAVSSDDISDILESSMQKEIVQLMVDNIQLQKKTKQYKKNSWLVLLGTMGYKKICFVNALARQFKVPIITIFFDDLIDGKNKQEDHFNLLCNVIEEAVLKDGPCIVYLDQFDLINTYGSQDKKFGIYDILDQLEVLRGIKGVFLIIGIEKRPLLYMLHGQKKFNLFLEI